MKLWGGASHRRHPDFLTHKAQHDLLVNKLNLLRTQFEQGGASLSVVANSLKLTYQWLQEHIYKADQVMAAHVKADPVP